MTTLTALRVVVHVDRPWLVGDPDGFGAVDTAPLRDHDGTPQIPATSLAGSLRDHLTGRPDLDVAAWMGEVRRGEKGRAGTPSRLRMLGVRLAGGDRTVTRTSTAVDPTTGSARQQSLRREEHVGTAATLTAYLMHDGPPSQPLLTALASWRPVIGRRRTNGWGRAAVAEVKHAVVDLRDRQQLIGWITGGGPEQIDQLVAGAAALPLTPATRSTDLLRVRFSAPPGVHIGAGELTETGSDHDGRARRVADIVYRDGTPYVPASSWRGVLRGHAMFVLRSLGCSHEDTKRAVGAVFGSSERRGVLTFHDAVVDGRDRNGPSTRDHEHVAIDRITGGARTNLLFTDRAAAGTVELRVTTEHPDRVPRWTTSLLGHAVRDMADGFLGIGGRTTRGLGTLELMEEPGAVVPAPEGIDIAEVAPSGEER